MTYLLIALVCAALIGLLVARHRAELRDVKAMADAAEARFRRSLHAYAPGSRAGMIRAIEEVSGITVTIEEPIPGLVKIIVPGVVTRAKAEQIMLAVNLNRPIGAAQANVVWTEEAIDP